MGSSGYGVELTVESMWSTLWTTAQFDFWNIIIGTQFNFWITEDGDTDITEAAVTSILAAESNQIFALVDAQVKMSAVHDPWNFMAVWYDKNLVGDLFFFRYEQLISKCKKILNKSKSIEIVKVTL